MRFCCDFRLKCDNHESEGTPQEFLSLAICTATSVNKDKKRTKNRTTSNVLLVIHAFEAYLHLPRSLPSCKTKQNKIETKQNEIEAKRNKMKKTQTKPKRVRLRCSETAAQSYRVL